MTVSVLLCAMAVAAAAQGPANPLAPPNRSSPRAALQTFLDTCDGMYLFMAREYLPSPSRAGYHRLEAEGALLTQCMDLSQVPAAARLKTGRAAAIALYETLSRIPLPPQPEIPGPEADKRAAVSPAGETAATPITHWVIPNTEITLVREASGPHGGEFLFSAETVARAGDFYERVRGQAYTRRVPLENLPELLISGGGWMVRIAWIRALPAWFQAPVVGQAVWKWVTVVLILGVFLLLLRRVLRLSHRGNREHPVLQALAQVALPAFLLLTTPVMNYLALVQLNLRGSPGVYVELAATAVMHLVGAWISWRIALVVAEAIIASPSIAPESIDAHLIRICTRLLGMGGGGVLLAMGADRLGLPVYGIIAGLGVGGLAIALAAQPTIENLIGGLNLFADKPIRVGDLCRCENDEGTIEAIGIRSTRLRGADRTLTAIPNAMLSKMAIVNLAQRDRMLIKSVLGMRYETRSAQLRQLLVKIRELLLSHPRIHAESARARFIGFGASSLDIEVFAYVTTCERAEFLAIQEDVWLRIMDIVEQSGSGFAFPSQTISLARDSGPDPKQTEAAEAQVRQWRADSRLPFPDFSPDEMAPLRDSRSYPPPGSVQAPAAQAGAAVPEKASAAAAINR